MQCRKTCPTNRGLRPRRSYVPAFGSGRKTCPTNRGLRLFRYELNGKFVVSEDLPHKSGITTLEVSLVTVQRWGRKTCPTNRGLRHKAYLHPISTDFVGRLAPQIGDYDQMYLKALPRLKVGRLAPQIGDYDLEDFLFP